MIIEKFSTKSQDVIESACRLAVKKDHEFVTPWHMLASMLDSKTRLVENYLSGTNVDLDTLGVRVDSKLLTQSKAKAGTQQTHINRELEKIFQNKIDKDVLWLEDQAGKMFSWEIKLNRLDSLVGIKALDDTFEGKEIRDLQRLRLYLRIGTSAAGVLGYVLFGPFGIAASLGGGIISERTFSKSIENQKQELSGILDDTIHQILHNAINTVQKRLRNIYTDLVETLQNQEETWFSTCRQVLTKESGASTDDGAKLNKQMKMIQEFISKLSNS